MSCVFGGDKGAAIYPRAGDNLLSFFTTADCASRVSHSVHATLGDETSSCSHIFILDKVVYLRTKNSSPLHRAEVTQILI